jgi:hypothetical protein
MGNDAKGIELKFDYDNGMSQSFYLDDAQAHDIVKIIVNKLNGRFEK